jgi:hypothetical protein
MVSKEGKVLDLGDYKRFNLDECLKEKFATLVLDEGGLSSPLSISLVIPTRFEPEGTSEIEHEALHRILAQCSKLVDLGYLDEIIIMGATRTSDGKPDFSILQEIVKIAYEELGLFKEQVDLINKYRSQDEKAKRGQTDFFLKTVHQFDQNIPRLLAQYGVFGASEYFGMLPGKGAGIWLSIPIAQGNVMCFVDADILNFQKEFVVGLCHPIIYSWNAKEAAIKLVKAYFTRASVTKTDSQTVFLGGRLNRLLAIPLLRSMTRTLQLYSGVESMKYPLAGEFAVSKDLIEQCDFPNSYAVETALLLQMYDLIGLSSTAQLDLNIYRHIGQQFESLETMAYHIVDLLVRFVEDKLGRVLTDQERDQLLVSFQENVNSLTIEYENLATRLKAVESDLVHSKESDIEKVRIFRRIVEDVLTGKFKEKSSYFISPSWKRVTEKTENYFALQEILRRRANQSTWSRLKAAGLLIE